MNKYNQHNNFEQLNSRQHEYERGVQSASIALELGKTAMRFARIERVPRYEDAEKENNAEHSFMLALVAPEIAEALRLDLDIGLVSRFSVVHDLIELKTGDIPTFLITAEQQSDKERAEHEALELLMQELPPSTGKLLREYEAQNQPESRFVRYIDKLLPIVVDVVGAGKKVMREDYKIDTTEQLKAANYKLITRIEKMFGSEFPEIDLAQRLLCELFEAKFDDML